MITPSIATADPHQAARTFTECGWTLFFESARDDPDPAAVVSLAGNTVMLTAATSTGVHPDAMECVGNGITFYLSVPGNLKKIHRLHHPCNPGPVGKRPMSEGGGKGFEVTICNFRFVISLRFD